MKRIQMVEIVKKNRELLNEKEKKFIDTSWKWMRYATPLQDQYLQAIYDKIIGQKYGLEPMATDKEQAVKRAKKKRQKYG